MGAGSSYDASVSDVSCDATTPDFHDGDSDLDPESVYEFPLRNGVTAKMKGWTHKRTYARGFAQNMHTGAWGDKPAEATVTGLQPHTTYTYAVYMYGKPDWGGVDGHHKGCHYFVKVNGAGEWETACMLNPVDPTVTGVATAQADGTILFQFKKEDSSYQIHLSGLSIDATASLTSRSPNSSITDECQLKAGEGAMN